MTPNYYAPAGPQFVSGYIAQSTPCRGCGQNLQGLHDSHRCPQCGLPAGRTLQPGVLRFAPPAWLQTVRSGLLLEFWTIITGIVVVLIGVAGLLVWVFSKTGAGGPPDIQKLAAESPLVTIAGPIVMVIFSGLLLYGVWLITTPEPQPGAALEGSKTRQATRAIALISFGVGVVSAALQIARVMPPAGTFAGIVQGASALLGAAQFVALLLVIAELSIYLPDEKLAGRARIVGWGGSIGMALLGLIQVFMTVFMGNRQPVPGQMPEPGIMVAGCVNLLIGIAVLVFYIMYLVTMMQLAGRIKQALAHSQEALQQPMGTPATAPPM